jgi:hypothetical protein
MKRLLALALLACVLPAAPTHAASLASATLTLRGGGFGSLAFPGAGATGTASSPSQAGLDAGTAFNATASGLLSAFPGVSFKLQLTQNDAGSFSGNPLVGNAAFRGSLSLFASSFLLGTLPFVLGEPAAETAMLIIPTAGIHVTAFLAAAGWTDGTLAFTQTSATAMGTNNLTANGAGTLTLVTPLVIGTVPASAPVIFGELQLTYVPEPGTALLLTWGVVSLALAGRRRSRARSSGA